MHSHITVGLDKSLERVAILRLYLYYKIVIYVLYKSRIKEKLYSVAYFWIQKSWNLTKSRRFQTYFLKNPPTRFLKIILKNYDLLKVLEKLISSSRKNKGSVGGVRKLTV